MLETHPLQYVPACFYYTIFFCTVRNQIISFIFLSSYHFCEKMAMRFSTDMIK